MLIILFIVYIYSLTNYICRGVNSLKSRVLKQMVKEKEEEKEEKKVAFFEESTKKQKPKKDKLKKKSKIEKNLRKSKKKNNYPPKKIKKTNIRNSEKNLFKANTKVGTDNHPKSSKSRFHHIRMDTSE